MKISQDLRLKAGNTGLHWVTLGSAWCHWFFYFWGIFTIFAIWSQTVTSCDQLVTTLFCSSSLKGWLHRVKMAFLWLTEFISVCQFSAFYDLVTPCDQLVTPGHTFILILKAQGIFLQSFVKIGQRLGPFWKVVLPNNNNNNNNNNKNSISLRPDGYRRR